MHVSVVDSERLVVLLLGALLLALLPQPPVEQYAVEAPRDICRGNAGRCILITP